MANWIDPNGANVYGGQNYYPGTVAYNPGYIYPQPRNVTGPIYYTDNSGQQNHYQGNQNPSFIPSYFVNSKEEALAYQMTSNQKAMFIDITKPLIYVRTINENGIPDPLHTLEYHDYVEPEYTPQQQVDMNQYVKKEDFDELKQKLEDLLK